MSQSDAATDLSATDQSEGLIALMSDTLANQIAAGEVVQRPASVAKELLENAVDAGASSVKLLVRSAGSSLVQVVDDGCGMNEVDAVRSFQRHATSKLRAIEDLGALHTYGFRGEALASVAAVAQVEMKTKRRQDAIGTRVRIDGNDVLEAGPCATAEGTSIAVRNLFYNVPARRNFLKSPSTEFKHLVEVFQRMALANPHVGFTLHQDDHEVYALPASDEPFLSALASRVAGLLGREHGEHLVDLEETSSYLSVRGVLGGPSLFRRSRGEQFLFVNGRAIKDRSLDYAVRAAYEAMLPEGSFPAYVVFLDIDPKHVDVNVHPAKSEVKFDDERGVFGFVRTAVRKALTAHLNTPKHELFAPSETETAAPTESHSASPRASRAGGETLAPSRTGGLGLPTMTLRAPTGGASAPSASSPTHSGVGRDRASPSFDGEETARLLYGTGAASESEEAQSSGSSPNPPKPQEGEGNRWTEGATWVLGQRYVVAALRTGLVVVDARLAHQRILYEKALADSTDDSGATQQLLFPITLELGAADHALVEESSGALGALGFDIEPFSGRAYVLRGVPPNVRSGEERRLFMELVASLREAGSAPVPERIKHLARLIAQHGAVGDAVGLSEAERKRLVADLLSCEMPYAAPNGATTFFQISADEVAKRLGQAPARA